jgi:hypothetical protein
MCDICQRAFLNTNILALHYASQAHKDAYARSLEEPVPPSCAGASGEDLLAPSGRSTPSQVGEYDLTYDALDEIPSRGRNALLHIRHAGQMEFWWQKVKARLYVEMEEACEQELEDTVLSLLDVHLPSNCDYEAEHENDVVLAPRFRAAKRRGAGRHLAGGHDFARRPTIPPQVRDALMVYFRKCLELRTAPSSQLLVYMREVFVTCQDAVLEGQRDEEARMHGPGNKLSLAARSRELKAAACWLAAPASTKSHNGGGAREEGEGGERGKGQDRGIELKLAGCLSPSVASIGALASFIRGVFWITKIDVSNNDLRDSGTAIL